MTTAATRDVEEAETEALGPRTTMAEEQMKATTDNADPSGGSLRFTKGNWLHSVSTSNQPEHPENSPGLWHRFKHVNSRSFLAWLRPQITFYRIHFLSFVIVDLIAALIMIATPAGSLGKISFIDALFNCTSALTVTGLASVRMNVFSTFDQVLLLLLMMVGSAIFTSLVPVLIRRHYFLKHLREEEAKGAVPLLSTTSDVREKAGRSNRIGLARSESVLTRGENNDAFIRHAMEKMEAERQREAEEWERMRERERVAAGGGEGGEAGDEESGFGRNPPLTPLQRKLSRALTTVSRISSEPVGYAHSGRGHMQSHFMQSHSTQSHGTQSHGMQGDSSTRHSMQHGSMPHHDSAAAAPCLPRGGSNAVHSVASGRNRPSTGGIAEEHPEEYGEEGGEGAGLARGDWEQPGQEEAVAPFERRFVELRALELLSWLVPVYFFGTILAAFILFIFITWWWPEYHDLLTGKGINVVFNAAFQSVSAFANAGFGLMDENLIPFQRNIPYLLVVAVLILVGNTMYAPMLRGMLALLHSTSKKDSSRWHITQYLLDHPRKCYTHLFPHKQTLWLLLTIVAFNTIQAFFIMALDWNSQAFEGLGGGFRFFDSWMQSISTRNAGYSIINLSYLTAATNFLFCGFMYVAVYPVFLTRQSSREQRDVHDSDDLAVFAEDLHGGVLDSSVLAQGRHLVAQDSVYLFVSVFLVCIIENSDFNADPNNWTVFKVIFEIISAYGNVGLSLGNSCPTSNPNCTDAPPYSFSGTWSVLSKLIVILVMLLGRHRGLPDNIDAAIVIPPPKQFQRQPARPITEDPAVLLTRALTMTKSQPSSLMRRISSLHATRSAAGAMPSSSVPSSVPSEVPFQEQHGKLKKPRNRGLRTENLHGGRTDSCHARHCKPFRRRHYFLKHLREEEAKGAFPLMSTMSDVGEQAGNNRVELTRSESVLTRGENNDAFFIHAIEKMEAQSRREAAEWKRMGEREKEAGSGGEGREAAGGEEGGSETYPPLTHLQRKLSRALTTVSRISFEPAGHVLTDRAHMRSRSMHGHGTRQDMPHDDNMQAHSTQRSSMERSSMHSSMQHHGSAATSLTRDAPSAAHSMAGGGGFLEHPQRHGEEGGEGTAGSDREQTGQDETVSPFERRFVELRALELLSWLVPAFYFGTIFAAFILFILITWWWPEYHDLLTSKGINVVFNSAFQSASAFSNSGISLLDANLIPFQQNIPYLLVVGVLILVGNTMYAPSLRGVLALLHSTSKKDSSRWHITKYLLDHPRKCYTQLFPHKQTLWLLLTIVAFTSIQAFFLMLLDWNSQAFAGLAGGYRFFDSCMQSVSTRSAGYTIINLFYLSAASDFLFVGFMYVAVYPVFLTRQSSREQRDIQDTDDIAVFAEDMHSGVLDSSVLAQGRHLVAQDSVYIFVSILLVCAIQNNDFSSDQANWTVFKVIFEIISAYGNVGLSLGNSCPTSNPNCTDAPPYSFSGTWSVLSKLIVILVMLLGRHRGLPDNIDAAIFIPPPKQFQRRPAQPIKEEPAVLLTRALTMTKSQPGSLMHRISSLHASQPTAGPMPFSSVRSSIP
ncbi:unnamed protein product [Closterium sp. Yama58-4]|nr:unnamed protein product [Closterium sp. Yama58-4]